MFHSQKTAFITGSSRGIGLAIATHFAKNGYAVALNGGKDKTALETAATMCSQYEVPVLSYYGDISNEHFVRESIQDIYARWGHLDVLINNAGISYIGLLTDMSSEEWHRVLDTNLSSLFYTCHEVVPHMVRAQQGHIINISSIWGNMGASCEVAYSASKGGVNLFTKALAKELAPSNIAANAISCGVIDTTMNQFLDETERNMLEEEIPAGRFGTTEEVAALAYSLATSTSYLTGQIIGIDGGF